MAACQLVVRNAEEEDVKEIMSVHVDCIQKVCSSHYSQDQIEKWVNRQNHQRYASFIKQESDFVLVLRRSSDTGSDAGGGAVAFGHMGQASLGTFSVWVTHEVYGFYVSPYCLRKGVGRFLFGELMRRALEQGSSGIGVVSTLNAVPFYEVCGFEVVGNHYHGDLKLECKIMEKKLECKGSSCRVRVPGSASTMGWIRQWLKMAWATQPVLVVACVMGGLGPLLVLVGPGTKDGQKEIENWPSHYRRKPKPEQTN